MGAILFLMSVALLFMTSLRGWYVTGHDIQTEYHVFRLTEVTAAGVCRISMTHITRA